MKLFGGVGMKKLLFYSLLCFPLLLTQQTFAANTTLPLPMGGSTSAMASANQEQGQVQGQVQSQNMANSGNSAVVIDGSFNSADPIRYLPVPTSVTVDTKGGPSMFGRPNYQDYGPNFMSMQDALPLFNAANLEEAEPEDVDEINMVTQLLISESEADDIRNGEVETGADSLRPKVKFSLLGKDRKYGDDFKAIAVVTLKADDGDTLNSLSLAVALANKARELGGTKIVFVREGVFKRLSSWGVGIGFASNYAEVSSGADGYGSTGTGGTGWSWGEAEYISLPYLTAVIGK